MPKKILVESAHSFGDILFNLPLIKSISSHYGIKVDVAIRKQYADALQNIEFINKIVIIDNLNDGSTKATQLGYDVYHQITQNIKFVEYNDKYADHSLIDTPLYVGRELGLNDFDQRPIFIPSKNELDVYRDFNDAPTIAIESVYNSLQSWTKSEHIESIINNYKNTHRILWLSHSKAPNGTVDLSKYTRREVIMLMRLADKFYSVGSGFFCASLALRHEYQPRMIIAMWVDTYYKYEYRINALKWHNNLVWVHNNDELQKTFS